MLTDRGAESRLTAGGTAETGRGMDDGEDLMDGAGLRFRYSGGLTCEVEFQHGFVSYVSRLNGSPTGEGVQRMPYQSRQIRPGVIHIVWYEQRIGDTVSIVVDLDGMKVYSGDLMGCRVGDAVLDCEVGEIERIIQRMVR